MHALWCHFLFKPLITQYSTSKPKAGNVISFHQTTNKGRKLPFFTLPRSLRQIHYNECHLIFIRPMKYPVVIPLFSVVSICFKFSFHSLNFNFMPNLVEEFAQELSFLRKSRIKTKARKIILAQIVQLYRVHQRMLCFPKCFTFFAFRLKERQFRAMLYAKANRVFQEF